MQRVSTLVAALVSIVIGTAIAAGSGWTVYSDLARSIVTGLMIGSGLRPYHVGLVPSETRLLANGYVVASG